jgi:response regulator RpfG family c-di-GMP phosphodiesterase
MIRKDGSVIWISTSAGVYRDENGNISGVQGVARDITAFKRVEKERQELERHLQHAQKLEAIGTLTGPMEALALFRTDPDRFDLMITDMTMPGITGIELTRLVKERYDADVMVMTGYAETYTYEKVIEQGAEDFIQKPFDFKELVIRLKRVLRERTLRANMNKANAELRYTLDVLKTHLSGTIRVIASIVEHRDPYTSGHQERLASAMAREMGLPENTIEGIRMVGSIHDLGKIAVPAEILSKPTRLTDTEFELVKTHPRVGFDILSQAEFLWPVAQITYQRKRAGNPPGAALAAAI